MRRIAAVLAGMAMMHQVMAGTPQWLMPNAWTIGIHLAQWLMKEQKKVFYVEVTSQGRDLREAREQAFRMAVEQAVGSVISSDTRVQLGRIQRDEIIVYSAGFVEDFELVDQRRVGSDVQVKMRVWVSHNKLANRLLSESRAAGQVEGGRISEQIQSYQHERATADRLLASVLDDYPRRAFDMSVGNTRVIVDHQRRTQLQVPVTVSWSQHYVDSLAEAVRVINQRADCRPVSYWNRHQECQARSRISVKGVVSYFDDDVAWQMMHREAVASRPQILLRVRDTQDRVRYQGCNGVGELDHHLHYTRDNFVMFDGTNVVISHMLRREFRLLVDIDAVSSAGLDRAEAEIVRLNQCPR